MKIENSRFREVARAACHFVFIKIERKPPTTFEPRTLNPEPNKGKPMGKVLRDYEVYLIHVDPDRCDSCKECVLMCPTDVFEMPHKAIPVRPQNCLGCLTCTAVCKSKAIIITEI